MKKTQATSCALSTEGRASCRPCGLQNSHRAGNVKAAFALKEWTHRASSSAAGQVRALCGRQDGRRVILAPTHPPAPTQIHLWTSPSDFLAKCSELKQVLFFHSIDSECVRKVMGQLS
ncbi:unnamed protein product [Rangifer tarandus platyrhynchus]|uniref:Uncharacterized protein n=2 Tax=Rangifer tarandus platyrhynchus TaxID=3082113 RepID=A0AC59ZN68_RANTA|nr:unnamed protein product [Rangifer tarandus platyrhynchus]